MKNFEVSNKNTYNNSPILTNDSSGYCTSDDLSALQQMLKDGVINQEVYDLVKDNPAAIGQLLNMNHQFDKDGCFEKTQNMTDYDVEFQEYLKIDGILNSGNPELLNDDNLLIELENLKDSDIASFLYYYKINHENSDFLDDLSEKDNIKNSTKEKFEKVFTERLEKIYNFDSKYKNVNTQTNFDINGFEYHSDTYNVKQLNSNILEIENVNSKEKRTIDYNSLLKSSNDFDSYHRLKSSLQKLPAEILWQIPDEIDFIQSIYLYRENQELESIDSQEKQTTEGMEESVETQTDGFVSTVDENEYKQIVVTSDDPAVIIHEIAHTVFIDADGNDALESNPKIKDVLQKAREKISAEGINLNYENPNAKFGEENEFYWTLNESELGAEVITSVMTGDYRALKTLTKYAPEAFTLVMEQWEKCKQSDNKHNPFTFQDLTNFLDTE